MLLKYCSSWLLSSRTIATRQTTRSVFSFFSAGTRCGAGCGDPERPAGIVHGPVHNGTSAAFLPACAPCVRRFFLSSCRASAGCVKSALPIDDSMRVRGGRIEPQPRTAGRRTSATRHTEGNNTAPNKNCGREVCKERVPACHERGNRNRRLRREFLFSFRALSPDFPAILRHDPAEPATTPSITLRSDCERNTSSKQCFDVPSDLPISRISP